MIPINRVKKNILSLIITLLIILGHGLAFALETQLVDGIDSQPTPKNEIPIFGQSLFQGTFKDQPFNGFNPDYRITVGDQINLQLWGAYSFSATLTVDPKGNIFVPEVGPVHVAGVQNGDLNNFVLRHVKRVFKNNVQAYANLEASQPVKVFVTGYVNNPGLFNGFSSDSILYYLDSAEGISSQSGSFVDIKIIRRDKIIQEINLYSFIVDGIMPAVQLRNGDVIVVGGKKGFVTVKGAVQQSAQLEFIGPYTQLGEMLLVIKPDPLANFARITQVVDGVKQASYQPLTNAMTTRLYPGAIVELVRDNDIHSISVIVSGELDGPATYVLPYGATLEMLMTKLKFRENADQNSIQLYRKSVAEKQQVALDRSLDALQMEVLTRQPKTDLEKDAQKDNALMIQNFIKKARRVIPKGQVVIANNPDAGKMLLEDGDEITVPLKTSTISIVGEVIFPTSLVYHKKYTLEDYIELAGGFANNANRNELIILHLDGTITRVHDRDFDNKLGNRLRPGDEIMVMPKINSSELQVTKDVTEILYRIAVGTAAILSF
ncbi:polysaccharide biosynthesis/export family protein [Microbulbifer variabilis]|uniref:Polysaccharide biosynthesis/export family protein n=2 Tax=Microbulbifer TaxID=48073 RepID=A0ABY4VIU9_9GAMM|nr:polysaccharide biosynthesis/export family protein [Microbulbifer variabilis]USD22382.1 polysaccharide biosynthesis/export family protein [Microbulbifer variabilis]